MKPSFILMLVALAFAAQLNYSSSVCASDPRIECDNNWGLWVGGKCQCPLFSEDILDSNGKSSGRCVPDLVPGSTQYEFKIRFEEYPITATLRVDRRDENWRHVRMRVHDVTVPPNPYVNPNQIGWVDAILFARELAWEQLTTNGGGATIYFDPLELFHNKKAVGGANFAFTQGGTLRRTNSKFTIALTPLRNTWNTSHHQSGNKGWMIVGAGDFNGDRILDLAWRRSDNTGEVRLWLYNKDGGWNDIGLQQGDRGWYVVGVGDFNNDGLADLAWRRSNQKGEVRLWLFKPQCAKLVA